MQENYKIKKRWRMNEQTDGWMNGQTDGRTFELTIWDGYNTNLLPKSVHWFGYIYIVLSLLVTHLTYRRIVSVDLSLFLGEAIPLLFRLFFFCQGPIVIQWRFLFFSDNMAVSLQEHGYVVKNNGIKISFD